ncbi:CDP-glycerol glycerophosphotransferase family protein [Herbidospora mongoliensis]|uniref:CDP-glycerol glycerophosphotransferase family protein n=1 Tax=Herbidospora mongoliensis TaxID=688067 RepID=UPI000833EA57|nr:CDP-glycerol glycerophosphotransferase family protein [Herbidospora mongoliensis]
MGKKVLVTGIVLGSYPVLVAAALAPVPWVFAVAVLVSYTAELALPKAAADQLSRVHLGVTVRFLAREMAAVLLLARLGLPFTLLAGGLFIFHAMRATQTGLALFLHRWHHLRPVESRNLQVALPKAPPERLLGQRGTRLLYFDAPPVVLAAASGLTGVVWPTSMGMTVTLACMAVVTAVLGLQLRRAAPIADRRRVIHTVDAQVTAYEPEVILYFSGSANAIYQASMWLPVLEALPRRALVVLRERPLFNALAPTSLPVLCIPSAVDMMNFRGLDSARVALFASNVGNNIHMLRVPGVVSVFVGHGDSDKEASFNPYTKVYDQVWVAGPAGRDRYRRADVGVRDDAIVEVGRPQLAGISEKGPQVRSVLYAPTWEGWTDDLFHSSVAAMGPYLIDALLAEGVRVVYKPHPLTGHRSMAFRRAHGAILERLRREHPDSGAVVLGSNPNLYDCFNDADLLISDISSVVADFMASGKPYVVTNVAGKERAEFVTRYPSAGAAYLLSKDLRELPEILAQLSKDPGEDELADARHRLRGYLLGDGEPMARFAAAVDEAYRQGLMKQVL